MFHKGYEWGFERTPGVASEQILKDAWAIVQGVKEGQAEIAPQHQRLFDGRGPLALCDLC